MIKTKIQKFSKQLNSDQFILVSIHNQRLYIVIDNKLFNEYTISTSRYGIGNKVNSLKTPLGIHRICERIGRIKPKNMIFKDRRATGKIWDGKNPKSDLITSRILRLEGLEEGINKGSGIDSKGRYIYIHGTNHETTVGTPSSHGCVTMKNRDIIELAEVVKKGDYVVITKS